MKNSDQIKKELYFYITPDNKGVKPKNQKRRITVAGVLVNNKLLVGTAACSSKDQFVKSKGRIIARGRALSTKAVRIQEITPDTNVTRLFIELAKSL